MHMSIDLPINCVHPVEAHIMTMGADGCTVSQLRRFSSYSTALFRLSSV